MAGEYFKSAASSEPAHQLRTNTNTTIYVLHTCFMPTFKVHHASTVQQDTTSLCNTAAARTSANNTQAIPHIDSYLVYIYTYIYICLDIIDADAYPDAIPDNFSTALVHMCVPGRGGCTNHYLTAWSVCLHPNCVNCIEFAACQISSQPCRLQNCLRLRLRTVVCFI